MESTSDTLPAVAAVTVNGTELELAGSGSALRLVADWLGHLEEESARGNLAPGTVRTYRRNVAIWAFWLRETGTSEPTPVTVADFLAGLRTGRTAATINGYLATVKALYRWSEATGRGPNIARAAKSLRNGRRDSPLPALRHEEVAELVRGIEGDSLRDLRDRALIATLYATAVRCVSLERADVADVDLDSEMPALAHQPKGHREKDSRAYLGDFAADALRVYLEARGAKPSEPIFASAGNRSGSGRLTTRSMRRAVLGRMEAAGFVRRDEAGRVRERGAFSAHSLRRSAVTRAAEVAGLEVAQSLAGHASIDTTKKHYARVTKDRELRELTAAMDLA